MKSNLLVVCTLVFGIFFQACSKDSIKPSDNVITKSYDFTDFVSLEVSDDFKVYVTFSESEESVTVEANDNLMEHIEVEMNGNTLKVSVEDNLNIKGSETLNLRISTAAIYEFKGDEDVEIYLNNELNADQVSIKLSGDSKLKGALISKDLTVDLSGDSYLTLEGSAENLSAELRGDSKIERYGFAVQHLDIDLKGDSEGYLTVTESLEVKARGDSYMHYKGNPEINKRDLAGDSELVKED